MIPPTQSAMNPEIAGPPVVEAPPARRNKPVMAAEAALRIQEGNRTRAAARLGPSTLNLGGLLRRHARYRGGHPALVVGRRTLNFRELNVYVNRLANALLAAGLRKGDKFATILPNCLELMASYWAAAKTGLVIVPAPLHIEHKKILNEVLPGRFYELYGLTEGFVTILDKRDSVRKLGSVGCPSPFFEIRILRPDGGECGTGEVGEICGRGPILMPGYYKQPELTRTAMADGLLHTGDAGYLDEDGYLFLVDRIKDMIISGGVNVYPHDIEEVVVRHPAVRETAVFGAPDEKWGEVPIAAVVAKEGASIDREELIAWTNARVDAKFQRIHDVVIYQEFPRNVAGKTLKREMRTRFAATRLARA